MLVDVDDALLRFGCTATADVEAPYARTDEREHEPDADSHHDNAAEDERVSSCFRDNNSTLTRTARCSCNGSS